MAAEAKTKPTKEKVSDFLNKIPDATRREEIAAPPASRAKPDSFFSGHPELFFPVILSSFSPSS